MNLLCHSFCSRLLLKVGKNWFISKAVHEIAPNTVANASKIIVLAIKIEKLVAKLATRTLWVLYILP